MTTGRAATAMPKPAAAKPSPSTVAIPEKAAKANAEAPNPAKWLEAIAAARKSGDAETAVRLAAEAETACPRNLAILIEHGAALRTTARLDEAESAYRRALAIDPASIGASVGLALTLRLRGDHEAAAALLRDLSSRHPTNANVFAELGYTLWQLNSHDEAESAYRAVIALVPDHAGGLAGLGHVARLRQDHATALSMFRAAAQARPDQRHFRHEIARTLLDLNQLKEAAELYEDVLREGPREAGILTALARVRRLQGDTEATIRILGEAATAATTAKMRVDIGIGLRELEQLDQAEATFRAALELTPAFGPALLQLGMMARARGDDEAALAHFSDAAAALPEDPSALFEVAVSLADLRRFAESADIMAKVEAMPEARAHDRLRQRRLEYHCTTMRLDDALACLREYGPLAELPTAVVTWAAALLAARGDWDEVLHLFLDRIVPGVGIARVAANELLLESVARAARARGRQAEILRRMQGWVAAGMPAAEELREQLAEEVLLLAAVRPGTLQPVVPPNTPLRMHRSARIAEALAVAPRAARGTFLLCSDLNYLPGSIVALASLVRHNRPALRECRVCIFLADEAMGVAAPMVARLAVAYGMAIEAIPASALGPAFRGLRIDWGNFSPGHRLSDAAYYRILAALWLAADAKPGRTVYLDSDTCIGPGVAGMLRLDLGGRPMAARREQWEDPAIRRAAQKLDIPPETYFNSGVMVLDLDHPAAVPALRDAIDIAIRSPERLSYVDQCALNLAFHGQVTYLPDIFNQFTRQDTDISELPKDAPVVHYLARPKPWDPAYRTENGARWIEEFCALSGILSPEQMRTLLALPFGDALPGK